MHENETIEPDEDARVANAPRDAVPLRRAIELSRFSGSKFVFKSLVSELFGAADRGPGDYQNIYTSAQIRAIRLSLMDLPPDTRRPKTLPPMIYSRMAKGGTGKTTIAGNVASAMALMGHRVLMIDGDPQASLTTLFGIDWARSNVTHMGHLLRRYLSKQPVDIESALFPIYGNGMLDLIPADISMAEIDNWLANQPNRETTISRMMKNQIDFFSQYDVIVIDSAPGSSQLANAFLYAAPRILPVVMLDGTSIKAMEVLAANLSEMAEAFPDVEFDVRIVANGFSSGINACRDALEAIMAAYPGQVDSNIIPRLASFQRQINLYNDAKSGTVVEREPSSAAAKLIIDLARSLIDWYGVQIAGVVPVTQPWRSKRSTSAT